MEVKKSPKADLAKSSPMFLEIGLIVALLITLLAFEWKSGNIKKAELSANDVIAAEEEIIPITEEENVVRPKMPTIPILSDAIDIVDDDIKVDEEMFSFEDSEDLGVDMNDYGYEVGEESVEEEAIPFALVEQKPMFQGGDANAFSKWVNQHLAYPDIAKENGIQGRVTLQFTVNTDGSVSGVKVLRGVDPSLDKEAVRVVSSSPKWTPGKQRDRPVKVTYTFPVIFQLK
ncbi:MAG: energy transducer TonB [Bacteroidales bacterium]|nr:energy transducer TonB [Bacteroidales bacterium]MBQ5401517.1 energy transducer TonB [Bacteroidales bacterium]MBQ7457685.1 energy transducer TonB [Bacteroidales bacterium]